jgi:FdhD protein
MNATSASRVRVHRIGHPSASGHEEDLVAIESPLQIIVNGEPFAVIMRTPGDDEALVAGFLLSEGLISSAADLSALDAGATAERRDAIHVSLASGVAVPGVDDRRRVTTNASCGMCGRVSVASIEIDKPPLRPEWVVRPSLVAELPSRLREAQGLFEITGGLHASGLFDLDGRLRLAAEDVGRHNALDKVVGRMLLDGRLPLDRMLLVVSGRTSYEIVQKAFLAGIPFVAAVSAPSSLAVELAEAAGLTLAGFVRGDRFNVYAHPERLSAE